MKNLSQNLSSNCLCCSFEFNSRSSLSNLNFERNVQIRCSRNRSQFDIQVCIFNIETSWFILLRERAFMTRIVEKVCTKTLFVINYASLWERLSLYWSFMFTFLRKLKVCIHRWTSSETCKAMNLLLLDRWIQTSIFKYLVEQSLKSLARNVTFSREHFDQHDSQHDEQFDEQFESRDLIILTQVDLDFFKLTQIFSSWFKFFQVDLRVAKSQLIDLHCLFAYKFARKLHLRTSSKFSF